MKKVLVLFILITNLSCSVNDDTYVVVKGTIIRQSTNEGVPNAKVSIKTKTLSSSNSPWSFWSEVDAKNATTDENGNFSVTLKYEKDNDVVHVYKLSDNYTDYEKSYTLSESNTIVIPVIKYEKLKIFVNNTMPFDANDAIEVSIYQQNLSYIHSIVQSIDNFGIAPSTAYYPYWVGTNVNSVINGNLQEGAAYKIVWSVRKNGITTEYDSGFMPTIYDATNEFHINY
ncbi:MAG: hypothetical protein V4648_07495 [Bacteroidota bacterium]